jgi:glycosyltransferase involved in cell wall biosynthesis
VDATRFHPPSAAQRADARARLGFTDEDFVVGMVAGFRAEKNHDVFFEGLSRAAPELPSLKVLAVGGGELLAQHQQRLGATGLALRTVFAGDVADVLPYLWAMDVGCLTPGSNEGFSNAVIEQMAAGVPLIVTAVGGNPEAVANGETGWVIPPLDAAALAQALLTMHQDGPGRAAMGRAARARVEARFSLEHMCAEHARVYTALCTSGSMPGARQ